MCEMVGIATLPVWLLILLPLYTRASHFGFMAPGCLHAAWLHFQASAARAGKRMRMALTISAHYCRSPRCRRFYLPLCISHGDEIPPESP